MLSLISNLLILVLTVGVVISYFFTEPNVLIQNGFDSFRYFTTDSNVLVAIVAIFVAIGDIRILSGKTDTLPKKVILLKFVGTACVTLTMTATVGFLMPVYGLFVIQGSLIIVHVITPLLALCSFVLWENIYRISIPKSFLGSIPMMIYGIVYGIEVAIIGEANGGWKDFYAYNRDGHWLLSTVLMTTGCFVIAVLTAVIHNLAVKYSEKKNHSDNQ